MGNPKLFISYSWSNPEHEEWVVQLAEELVENGVDVKLDKWDLKEGHDAYAFMESMVTDDNINKVIVVCDKTYAQKADKRKGGVGTEAQIISQNVYEQVDQNKFVAVVKEKDEDEKAYIPTFFKSRIYIDLSDNDLYVKSFEQLLRWIYDKPLYIKPELGKKPSFLSDENHIILGTSSKFKRAIDAIRNGKNFAHGALHEYLNTFTENLEKFRIQNNNDKKFDDKIIKNIEEFIPYRNEMIEIFLIVAQYSNNKETYNKIHEFFENIMPYSERPEHITQYHTFDFDNYKFIIQELFLYAIASLLKYECFDAISLLINQEYYNKINDGHNQNAMIKFSAFRNYLYSLEYRKERLKLNRASLSSDLIKERVEGTGIKFEQLMQADFILFLRSSIDRINKDDYSLLWWPDTLVYATNRYKPFELFARAQSKDYILKLNILFNIDSKDKFNELAENIIKNDLVPKWNYYPVGIKVLMNLDKLYSDG